MDILKEDGHPMTDADIDQFLQDRRAAIARARDAHLLTAVEINEETDRVETFVSIMRQVAKRYRDTYALRYNELGLPI